MNSWSVSWRNLFDYLHFNFWYRILTLWNRNFVLRVCESLLPLKLSCSKTTFLCPNVPSPQHTSVFDWGTVEQLLTLPGLLYPEMGEDSKRCTIEWHAQRQVAHATRRAFVDIIGIINLAIALARLVFRSAASNIRRRHSAWLIGVEAANGTYPATKREAMN